jgi:hypothetical protein
MTGNRRGLRIGRTVISSILVLAGTLLTLVGIVFLWADDTLYNADHFAATTLEAVKQPVVRTELSRTLVDQAIEIKPDLLAIRPLLETIVETLVTTPFFRKVLALAITDLHRGVIGSGERSYAIDVSNALAVGVGRLRVVNPQLADQIPPDIHTGLIEFGKGRFATGATQLLVRLHVIMLVLGVAGVVMLIAGIAVAQNRRAAITAIGVALACGALLLLLVLGLGSQLLMREIQPESRGLAAASVFGTFTEPLTTWLWITGIAGVLVATAASASLQIEGAGAEIERLRRALSWRPASRWSRVGAAAVALALGAGLLLAPELALMLLARGAGLLVLYIAGVELLRLAGIGSTAIAPRTRAERIRSVRGSLAVRLAATGGLVVLALAGAATLWIYRADLLPQELNAEEGPRGCNGYVELCDRPVNQVAFAGTHNSQSAASVRGFYFAEQLHDVRSQLDAGVRAFLIKSHYGIQAKRGILTDLSRDTEEQRKELIENVGPDGMEAVGRLQASFGLAPKDAASEPYLCHGFCELGAVYFEDTLTEINTFLDKHPNEVIIIFIGDYVSPSDTEAAFAHTKLLDRVYRHRPGAPWPTLQEMIDMDRRVLVLSEHAGDLSKPDWYHDGWSIVQDTPYAFKSAGDLQSDASCAQNRGSSDAPLFLINHWVPSQTPSPTLAEKVNSYDFLFTRVRRCEELRHQFPNIIAVDFSEKGDLFQVVDAVNQVGKFKP